MYSHNQHDSILDARDGFIQLCFLALIQWVATLNINALQKGQSKNN